MYHAHIITHFEYSELFQKIRIENIRFISEYKCCCCRGGRRPRTLGGELHADMGGAGRAGQEPAA